MARCRWSNPARRRRHGPRSPQPEAPRVWCKLPRRLTITQPGGPMAEMACGRRPESRRSPFGAALAAAALAVGLLVSMPGVVRASAGTGGGAQLSTPELKGSHIEQPLRTQSIARQSAITAVAVTPCDTLFKGQSSPNRTVINELESVSATTPNDIW